MFAIRNNNLLRNFVMLFAIVLPALVLSGCAGSPAQPSPFPTSDTLSAASPPPSVTLDFPSATFPAATETAALVSITGWFITVWGGNEIRYSIADEQGNATQLLISDEFAASVGGMLAFDRKFVTVTGIPAANPPGALQVLAIRVEDGQESP